MMPRANAVLNFLLAGILKAIQITETRYCCCGRIGLLFCCNSTPRVSVTVFSDFYIFIQTNRLTESISLICGDVGVNCFAGSISSYS